MESTMGLGQALVIVPTYNECENITRLVTQLRGLPELPQVGSIHVVIVDDHSPDGTGKIADELAAADPHVHVIHREGKLGLGTAYRAGFKFGLAQGYRYLCTMDADFSHDPQSLPELLSKAASGYDLVVGSRYVSGGKIVGCTLIRQIISYSANWLAHLILNVATHDCTAGFRCYRRSVLETLDLDAIFSSGYSYLVEMAFYCQQAGFRIGEVPITFVNRREGTSKISRTEIFKAFYTLLRLRTSALPWDQMVDFYHSHRLRAREE